MKGDILENASFDDGAHDSIHAGAVAPRSEDSEFHFDVLLLSCPHKTATLYTTGGDGRWGRKLYDCWGGVFRLDKIRRALLLSASGSASEARSQLLRSNSEFWPAACTSPPLVPPRIMVHLRLNENEPNPNPHVNFITALPMVDAHEQERARQLLRALAAQVRPIMKAHGFVVNRLEEVRRVLY